MKKRLIFPALCLLVAPVLAQASCESVIEEIKQKIINNGVPADNFSLVAVPNDEAEQAQGQVVGHCQNETYKIIYTRH
ncbi:TPA: DUF1161 domain-containing protein [Providencia stuartii]|uniref:DUF1161 domain-containing protein n=4 Tax=Enterobacterales TaxID=91347 RepID=A0AAJ1N548_PROST|nr:MULTISPECIES: DUF1161 domain-containing protein [Providencia]SST01135.1 Protein of uncharacterised function (DUF1161) [Acinetobacter baumannii]AFH91962.1 hypothetical protein S70_00295 [Providencia stuartii MRSN 2154]AIN65193.1 hypothetical protein DR96_3205 [Providencia stuartii]APG50016.1 hypothetical protein BGK56_03270 [Providencia stuartii]AVE43486.1 DUF1161 domain-containing protein [Providencia stuartii]